MGSKELVENGVDITPEHTRRIRPECEPMHTDILAAYKYVGKRLDTADTGRQGMHAWHGWALREAFLAGITYAATLAGGSESEKKAEFLRMVQRLNIGNGPDLVRMAQLCGPSRDAITEYVARESEYLGGMAEAIFAVIEARGDG